MYEIFEQITHINETAWSNPKGSYDDKKEASYQIEEALEGFDNNSFEGLFPENFPEGSDPTPKEISRVLVDVAMNSGNESISDVDRFDKALDHIYYAVGAMHKLGLRPSQMVAGLQIVHDANKAKTGEKDGEGKVIKPTDFIPPEEKLMLILAKR